ncbi:MAG TPA: transglutaminase-like domain-containing protein, partial [Candidatus Binatia bacterium]|nr:transglutaminase-like domain-containing protein [Candidatus Binatia bacterium]
EDALDLGRAALAIARAEYPQLDVGAYLARIDELAAEVRGHLGSHRSDLHHSLAALSYVLFQKKGYRGNHDQYFDPKNSFLNDVIDRRTGIPITLSVLYLEIARRIGLQLRGVGFPGHFLVKYLDEDQQIVIDPFNGGDIKTPESMRQLLKGLYGSTVPWTDRLLDAVTKRQILRRMLNNLKFIYLKQRDYVKALAALDRMIIAEPNLPEDLRERGAVYQALEYFPQAKADFENYLRLAPDAPDAGDIRE